MIIETFARGSETNDIRIEEELNRPRVETYIDEWGAWVSYQRAKDKGEEFTPHFGIGWS